MMKISSVLTNWATRALIETPDFDIQECVTIQFGDNLLYEKFFQEIREARGWLNIQNEFRLRSVRAEQHKLIDLLNEKIESIYPMRNDTFARN
ncbi:MULTISPECIES: hypothetical protein [unclassified Paenibacillus]|uniref:Uncharacterized protein n=1 Tax=Paenibacillus provencensis TaxID=441151 RepID=A0ABW3Q3I0_9BACL|nr:MULTISPECIES: hypothetical protein [unclassified Paenibacillus]MCM3130117.1 hypothetical protein [Paenibacillus sp. MER 78]SDX69921.1 hypothetical protein SAMN05518848_1126 [Paenibacillus sp. PDC88]SFS87873.1 hypothetical protein SAMN04488601_1061 [Paenibacillus sp. 453mf]